ncbi:MAG: rhamnulokinase [Marinilabiliales bacterium]|nr:MAG: rhamnulokinase [Marinilabiliales bacterium]
MTKKEGPFLAFDFGAESSRAVAGTFLGERLVLKEIYRFKTGMLPLGGHLYWNIYRFYEEMIRALICCREEDSEPRSIAVDSWGVDFGMLAADGTIVRIPYAYRDPQVIKAMHDFHRIIPPERIYALTGISMQPFNSLYHLHAMRLSNDLALDAGERVMFLPDLLNYLLSGVKKTEFSFATTSQLYNPFRGEWEEELLGAVGLDGSFMNEIIEPGQVIGSLSDDACRQSGLKNVDVASVCSHDTGSAIVAVPAEGDDWAYISSGTWSLMGLELDAPLVNEKTFKYNFSNEGGAGKRFRFLKNIMGLWLLQQCREKWKEADPGCDYPSLIEEAGKAEPFRALIDPDHEQFFSPRNMVSEIDAFCNQTGQAKPASRGAYVRAILESLALKYRYVLEQLQEVSGRKINTIHIIGGGTRNKMLCRFTANATGKKVITGPAEGTAAGNILMQALACGQVSSLEEIRSIVKNSFDTEVYMPEDTGMWDNVFRNFINLVEKG